MQRPWFMPESSRGRASDRVRERRDARFERMREERAKGKGSRVDSADWYEQTMRRLRDEQNRR